MAVHEGKGYNFDFDFFRGDRLVCSEVVYRALDGIGDCRIQLVQRLERPTLSAEDLLDMALADNHFQVVAIQGTAGCEDRLVEGPEAVRLLRDSYRRE